ncbi:MAG: ATP-grasp domain-containing protein [Candidatus Hodarchaeota archaeon]
MKSVFVTSANFRQALAVVRSLGKKNINVIAGEQTHFATAFFSKYCKGKVVYPSPNKQKEAFLEFIIEHIRKKNYDAIFPIEGNITLLVAKYKNEFSKYTRVPIADFQILSKTNNKLQVLKMAMKCGIPVPKTYFVNNIVKLSKLCKELTFPVVIKPQASTGSRGLAYVTIKDDFLIEYSKIHEVYPYPLVQEYIPKGGDTLGVSILMNKNSDVRAVFVHKRLREFPISGGPSTLRESIIYPEITEMAIELLKSFNWWGVAMVEFKVDPRDEKPKLMEINPRFWGSLQLAILSGVDFPYLLYKMTMQGDIKPILKYKTGIKCRWLLPGDILHFLANPKRFNMDPSFFNFFNRQVGYDMLSSDDPCPTFGFMLAALRYVFDKQMWKFILRL